MRLKFIRKHISIEQFNETDIPDFCVLTGVNGSGKSHLLEAIKNGSVAILGMEQSQIVHFNYENFRLDNEPSFSGHQIAAEREAAWQFHNQNFKGNVSSWKQGLGNNYDSLKEKAKEEKKSFWSIGGDLLKQYKQNFKNHIKNLRNNKEAVGIYSLAKSVPYSIDEIEHDEFVARYKPFTFKNDFLPVQLGKVFWDYYVKFRTNEINRFENEKYGKNYEVLSDEEFFQQHGEKPWELANRILEAFDTLHYKFGSPEGADYFGNYKLQLLHTEKVGLEVEFDKLSSGERILMALVASIYKASSDGNFPDVLLLDEVDASLHPSMMKNMLGVVENIFVPRGVKVILVTHSPTTIALAPEKSICVMNPSGLNRIECKSQKEALGILTQGFATLEQGLKIFDQVARSEITIISEGRNVNFISKYLELERIQNIDVLLGSEDASGKNQLKVLYDFFSKIEHENDVIFVFDCDVKYNLEDANNTYSVIFPRNLENTIADKGIENLFDSKLLIDFAVKIQSPEGAETKKFHEPSKKKFENFILARNQVSDFTKFNPLKEKISQIRDAK